MISKLSKFYTLVLILVLFYLWSGSSSYIKSFDYKIYDFFSKKLNPNKSEQDQITPYVVIVDIDQKSVDRLGQWPWSRIIDAQLIKKINQAHPSSIGMDILFTKRDKTSIVSIQEFYKNYMQLDLKIEGLEKNLYNNDKIFANTLAHTKTILAVYLQANFNEQEQCEYSSKNSAYIKNAPTTYEASSMLCNIDMLHRAVDSFGFINAQADEDGIFRRTPLFIRYKNSIIPTFALANLLALDKNIEFLSGNGVSILGHSFHADDDSHVLMNFYEPQWYKHISAVDILDGKIDNSELVGKIVLVGTSLIGQNDRHIVTTGEIFNGMDIQATIIENILNDHLYWQPSIFKYINLLLGLIISIVTMMLLYEKVYHLLVIVAAASMVLPFLITLILFRCNIYLSLGYLWFPLILYFIVLGFIVFYLHYQEKKQFFNELSLSHSATLDSMVMVAETKDYETGAHLIRTKEYIKLLAIFLKENGVYREILTDRFIDIVYRTAPLHDIGKVGIPDAILQKPGRLTDDEFKIMREHSTLGMKIISNAMNSYNKNDFLTVAYNIAYYHHEKWDGNGYPLSLTGDEIPLEARLMALVDVYDALISKRCYKAAFSYEKAENIILNESNKHFDPKIVEAFTHLRENFREIAEKNR